MKRADREAIAAGRQWVRDNRERDPEADQSVAMDLGAASGLDPEMVYEGILIERKKGSA